MGVFACVPRRTSSSCEFRNVSVFKTLLSPSRFSFIIEKSCNIGRWYTFPIRHWHVWTEAHRSLVGYQRHWSTKLKLCSSSAQWNPNACLHLSLALAVLNSAYWQGNRQTIKFKVQSCGIQNSSRRFPIVINIALLLCNIIFFTNPNHPTDLLWGS
jgi:hypothetical protein